MKRELEDKLFAEHPLLYGDRTKSMRVTCMCWGISCGDGWFNLLWDLSQKLEPLIAEIATAEAKSNCYNCGCKYYDHRPMPSGERICAKVHKMPYRVGKARYGCTIPQWKRDLKQAWEGKYWIKGKNRIQRLWHTSKQLLKQDWGYTKYRNLNRRLYRWINICLGKLQKVGLQYDLPCTCNAYEIPYPRASQVKEKFGTLCFYMTSATEEMWKLIHEAERKSGEICEDCGEPGITRGGGWVRTLCEKCEKDYQERRGM